VHLQLRSCGGCRGGGGHAAAATRPAFFQRQEAATAMRRVA
jgi:hypothetical protein